MMEGMAMRPESRALGQVLLDHHRTTTSQYPPTEKPNIEHYLLAYNTLCSRANVPYLTRTVGAFLGEIAQWCADNRWPPLNALAVNANTRMPGEGYDGAGGFLIVDWPAEAERCIRFKKYPVTMPNTKRDKVKE
jgi:hypothetical protein